MTTAAVLQRPALVLNRHWAPITTTTVQTAISLVAKGSALIIEPGTFQTHDLRSWNDVSRARAVFQDALIRSPRMALVVPEVIVLKTYDGRGERAVVFSRRNLFKRDHYTCQYCGAQPGPEELTVDHVLPRSKGGYSTWENCVLACVSCNARKANRTPEQAGMRLLRAPSRPTWKPLYDASTVRVASWSRFLSEAYWNVSLEESA